MPRKLTAEQVADVRLSDDPLTVVAERHGIGLSTASLIRRGLRYAELPDARPQAMATPQTGALPVRYVDTGYRHPDPELGLDECWIWLGTIDGSGYGLSSVGDRTTTAHRRIYTEWFGPIPERQTLDHLCRCRSCVNPFHVEVVSHAENVHRGDLCKLDWTAVDEIRSSSSPSAELAARYDVATSTISRVRSFYSWKPETRMEASDAPTTPKRCSKCGVETPLDSFHRNGRSRDGHVTQCKACISEYAARYYVEHRDERIAYAARYRDHRAARAAA